MPYEALGDHQQFCWIAIARDTRRTYSEKLPEDKLEAINGLPIELGLKAASSQ
jgi:hypothetical protein